MAVLIVPRGLSLQYYEFLQVATRANQEELVIDRRRERRRRARRSTLAERRANEDRRGPVPETWDRDNLILLP